MKKSYKHDIIKKEKTAFQQRLYDLRNGNIKLPNGRQSQKLTGQQLADFLNVGRDSIVQWENDETRLPSLDKLILLADFYGVSLDYLLGRSDFTKDGNEYISSVTGLSDKAINKMRIIVSQSKTIAESNEKNLKRIVDENDNCSVCPVLLPLHIDTVNFLVESKLFLNLINTLSYFLNSDKFSKFLDSHFKKIDTDSLYPADENYICGSFDIPINSDTQKALAKNLLDVQLNKLSEEFKKKDSGKK